MVSNYQILGVRLREANKLQQTGAWFNERTGKLTASRMKAARAFLRQTKEDKEKGKPPAEKEERRKLRIEILCERMTGNIVPKYVTADMQHGIDQEAPCKDYLTVVKGWTIKDLGFVEHPSLQLCGCSPDGWIEEEGALLEIKCPTSSTMIGWLLSAKEDDNWLPEEHIDQMLLQSSCFGGIPVYFVAFDPRLPEKQKLLIRKFTPTPEQIEKVEEDAKQFLEEVDRWFDILNKGE